MTLRENNYHTEQKQRHIPSLHYFRIQDQILNLPKIIEN